MRAAVFWRAVVVIGVALAVLPLCASSVCAGPWIKDLGDGFVKVAFTSFEAEQSFNQGVSTGLAYVGQTTNVYAEAGLGGGFQLIGDLPLVVGTNTSPAGVNYVNATLGDMRLELNYGLLDGVFPVALGVETKWPLYTPVAEQGAGGAGAFPRSRANFPDPGDGNVDATFKVLSGVSLYPWPAWLTAELGYRTRFGGFADGIFAVLGGGAFLWPEHVAVGFFSNAVVNVEEDPNPARRSTREFTYVQGYVLITGAPALPGLALTASVGSIITARNAARGDDFSVGVSYEF